MTYYYKLGEIPHKRHTQFRQPDGSLYHEEVMGIHGFAGIQSILYHVRPPTQVRRVETEMKVEIPYEDSGPLRPRHLCSSPIPAGGDAVEGRAGCEAQEGAAQDRDRCDEQSHDRHVDEPGHQKECAEDDRRESDQHGHASGPER